MLSQRLWAIFFLVVGGGLGIFLYTGRDSFRLGLDLRGGSHLVYEADVASVPAGEVSEAMISLRAVIERRINAFGVTEPLIQVEEGGLTAGTRANRLIIELPGVTDLAEATKLINRTPTLEFKAPRPEGPEKEKITAAWQKASELLAEGQALPNDPLLNQDPDFVDSGLTGRYLKRAQVAFNQQAITPSIDVEFTSEGAKLFAELTAANVERPIGIYLDGVRISAPTVREPIRDGRAEISGQFTLEEAKQLARDLNLGALPVPIKLVSTQTIGATLGADALAEGIKAGLIGFAAVALFMLLWYRLPGLVAVVALGLYGVLLLTIFRLTGVTLTAAGLAGFVLSFGMALDGNILIFERLKEELGRGRFLDQAIREGFARAWLSIRDANLASLIAALVLFWLGTAFMRGFAVTLGLGLIVGLFTSVSVTRTLLGAVAPRSASGGPPGRFVRFLFKGGLN